MICLCHFIAILSKIRTYMSDTFTYMIFILCHLILDIFIPTFIKRINLGLRKTQDHITGKSQSWDSPRSVCPNFHISSATLSMTSHL